MTAATQSIYNQNNAFDWDDVERKVKVILYRFRNLDWKYKEDLAQELRLFAYEKSALLSHMQNKAIDYFRVLSCSEFREDTFDFQGEPEAQDDEFFTSSTKMAKSPEHEYLEYQSILDMESAIRKELKRCSKYVSMKEMVRVAYKILPYYVAEALEYELPETIESTHSKHRSGGLTVSWLSDQVGETYRKVQSGIVLLQRVTNKVSGRGQK